MRRIKPADTKQLIHIRPDRAGGETGLDGLFVQVVQAEFVRVFGVQGVAFGEFVAVTVELDLLVALADQVHFDAALRRVVKRVVRKLGQRKVAVQLPVGTRQQVQVEGGGDALCIVIGCMQRGRILHQINPQQQRAAVQHLGGGLQKLQALLGREVADAGAGEKPHASPGVRQGRRERQKLGVVGGDGLHAQVGEVPHQMQCGVHEVRAGNVDRQVTGRLLQRGQQQAHLEQGAGAKFDNLGMGARQIGNLMRVALKQDQLGAGGVVLGQTADALKQQRAQFVVKVLGRNAMGLRGQGLVQVVQERGMGRKGGGQRRVHRASRNPENCQRAAGGKKLR